MFLSQRSQFQVYSYFFSPQVKVNSDPLYSGFKIQCSSSLALQYLNIQGRCVHLISGIIAELILETGFLDTFI